MSPNSFGDIFRITTWGESHGKAIGVVIDGCPAGLELDEAEINDALSLRSPGKSKYTSSRKETDRAEILSGVFEGKTTGAPISIIIPNVDVNSKDYKNPDLLRPGHANYTYLKKYGIFDHRGGGRASARETACRVAAGAVAKKLLGDVQIKAHVQNLKEIESFIEKEEDSIGAIVEVSATGVPVGLGDPVYKRMDAAIAHAMMSIPATKGVEIGSGFAAAKMKGSEHNDQFAAQDGQIQTKTNRAGGILGGITNGMPIIVRVAFKPTPSIKESQETIDMEGNPGILEFSEGRHDPCCAIRAVPVVEAMMALVLADAMLRNRVSKLL